DVLEKFDIALDDLWPRDIAPAPKTRSRRASDAGDGCGSGVMANRNFLPFRFREGNGANPAIPFPFEQQARMFLIRFLRNANGVANAFGDFGNIGLTER